MLQLRPSCECCNLDLPPDSTDAFICTFECTFCRNCATQILKGKCPNCGGELLLAKYPASTERIHKPDGCKKVA